MWHTHGFSDGSFFALFRLNAEKLFRFRQAFKIEVVFADNAFGISRLKCLLAHRAKFGDEHRNKRVPHDIVGEIEVLGDNRSVLLKVGDDDGVVLEGIRAEPGGKVGLNRDITFHLHLGYFGFDMGHTGVELDVLSPELEYFTGAQAGRMPAKRQSAKKGTNAPSW